MRWFAMANQTLDDFLTELRKSGILDASQLDQLHAQAATGSWEAEPFAGFVQEQGWLTAFQAERILQGRGNELVIEDCVLREEIGEGRTGHVYKALHPTIPKAVAIKIISKERFTDPGAIPRFVREIGVVGRAPHLNIVTPYSVHELETTIVLVMEYVEEIDIATLIRDEGPLPIGRACDYLCQVANGLRHIARLRLVHRDIKPSNLLLDRRNGTIKILDFGLSRLRDDASAGPTGDNIAIGTPDYLAPEQDVNSHRADLRADLYSLGCVAYHMLAGRPPFAGGTALDKVLKHREALPVPIAAQRPDMPPELASVVRTLMEKSPSARYQSPDEVIEALAPFVGLSDDALTRRPMDDLSPVDLALIDEPAPARRLSPRCAAIVGAIAVVTVGALAIGIVRGSNRRLRAIESPRAESVDLVSARYESLVKQGQLLFQAGDDRGALARYDEALRINPRGGWAHNGRANCLRRLGSVDLALLAYHDAIRAEPGQGIFFANRGETYGEHHDIPRALADLSVAIRLRPDDGRPLVARGRILLEQHDFDAAITDFSAAIRLVPNLTSAYMSRIAAYVARNTPADRALADADRRELGRLNKPPAPSIGE
jgi:Flp pilus assembly protein TadD